MVSKDYIEKQLKELDFKISGWGRAEVAQLPHIILPDERIYEVVNGIYEGGFALLLATDIRVLLVDKKPMSFLTVEDLRFDMINEIDYNHRFMGAYITIATGNKTLLFRSYNKARLRKLIGHVQHCMAETKKKQSSTVEDQGRHLEKINQQLQAYLVAQYKQQQKLQEHLMNLQLGAAQASDIPELPKPSPELSDFLYAHGLLETYYNHKNSKEEEAGAALASAPAIQPSANDDGQATPPADDAGLPRNEPPAYKGGQNSALEEIYAAGIQEVFGKKPVPTNNEQLESHSGLVVNPIKVAYSKLPQLLKSKKIGLPLPSIPAIPPLPHYSHLVHHKAEPKPAI